MTSKDVGFRLKRIREKLGLTQEAIQDASQEIAQSENNPDFAIRHSHLSVIENSNSVPNIFKLFSMCAIYKLDLTEVLSWYGLSKERLAKYHSLAKIERTHLMNASLELLKPGKNVVVPARLDPSFDLQRTSFLTRLAQAWKEIPVGLLARMDLRNRAYGFVGMNDYTMFPLLRPGSFVELDVNRNTIISEGWKNEFDRPIYFLDLRNRCVVCWASVVKDRLHVLPHPLSPCKPDTVLYPDEVDVVGQVVGVTMRLLST